MQRLKDYAGFGIWFLGLGYMMMWALAGPLNWPFGEVTGGLCGALPAGLPPALCVLAHPQALSPPMHLVGLLAAITVLVQLLLIALRSSRKPPADSGAAKTGGPSSRRWRRPEPTVKKIKARDHFGLRGLER